MGIIIFRNKNGWVKVKFDQDKKNYYLNPECLELIVEPISTEILCKKPSFTLEKIKEKAFKRIKWNNFKALPDYNLYFFFIILLNEGHFIHLRAELLF